ncbi:dephospho-CoA kinase [Endothiovibrio diazotrophicus]
MAPALVVALTGGIGSGKSAVSERFAARGVPVVDTDVIAREVVRPGTPGLAAVVEAFGGAVLDGDGRLDRAALRHRVFAAPAERRRLEAILHPLIRAEVRRRVAALDARYCIVVIPLLVEGGGRELAQRVLVVDAPDGVRRARVVARDGLDEETIDRIFAAQASRDERLAWADEVIVNGGGLDALDAEVAALHRKYLVLAADGAAGARA